MPFVDLSDARFVSLRSRKIVATDAVEDQAKWSMEILVTLNIESDLGRS